MAMLVLPVSYQHTTAYIVHVF